MDESVIEINDSIITIGSEADLEDGEVQEISTKEINNAANLQQPPIKEPSEATNDQQNSNTTEEDLVFEVRFNNVDEYDRLQERLLQALQSTFAAEKFEYKTTEQRITVHSQSKSPAPDNDLFMIDTAPTCKLNAAQVPSYKRCHGEVLDEETFERKKRKLDEVNKCFRPKAQSACFNCGGTDHSLRECTRPRNQARIQRARKKKVERYHVDTEQRFAHIRPGKISSKTRHAMGFSRGELPFMFYRMRVLGYPPAWLEEAKVQSSGISLFNADGSEVQAPEQEEGESESFKYDVNKIIDFPGFNVHPGAKFYDDYQHHNVPRFQQHQLKENFIKSLGENVTKGYKRKKLIDLPASHDTSLKERENDTNLVEHDMDLDDDDELEQSEEQPSLPFADATETAPPAKEEPSKRSPSPTLDDLQAQQAKLLQQLDANTSLNTSEVETKAAPDAEVNEKSQEISSKPAASSQTAIFKAPSIAGTPILKFSVYDKLPVGDNFKVGVSDVINFENLPDSTGKYEQMKGVLKNVRRKMEELQNNED
ncbi:zinc finger CCHC domain-containing protein 8 homolog isoform X1 [Drosophila mojavensis]|uniref:PSP proline-rich domain-containing protein n=1 Tax=Drosophila mojavensis TaxID=7230 RepID=A0A0Q9X812_DROMO|nr:zinc finger CCHC domain-containing protein 8 homolog isoform X1 [Drosophila mojavensis]KRG04518.1 uncharacterized protein Dmoj_GI25838 [Drosophila mojavensis]